MKKLIAIGWKDLTVISRDRAALIFTLLAPFLLIVGLGFVTGRVTGNSGIEAIPVAIVNQDDGRLGEALIETFRSDELAELVRPMFITDAVAARRDVDADRVAAAVIVPSGFTDSIIPRAGQPPPDRVVKIVLYKNPARPVSAGVIQAIVEGFLSRVETGRVSGEVIVRLALNAGLIAPDQIETFAAAMGERLSATVMEEPAIRLRTPVAEAGTAATFDPMAYMAPGVALLFLMFTVSNGGRSLLVERSQGTLARLLISPTTGAQVLVGKLIGTYLTGVLQMAILIAVSSLLFGLHWGDLLGVVVLILAVVFGAIGWGMLITALARTPNQVGVVGSAVMLIFGILGGSFVQLNMAPEWLQWMSRLTPNAWGLDGFTILSLGGTLADLGRPLLGLTAMGLVVGGIAIALFNRRPLLGG
ncbi:MAG: hypothetical protein KatS3mg053_1937 [Candidatus Roseilinea sp.]|nr:MAG: hypothetical protein KatS3mg053_1937 [Candidatus Roseilinea sp.]